MSEPDLMISSNTPVSEALREMADAIDHMEEPPELAVIILSGDEQVCRVAGLGEEVTSNDIVANLTFAQHIMMNYIMPFGVLDGEGCNMDEDDQ